MKTSKIIPKPEMVPKMYCAAEKTTCDDIQVKCATCPVWKENKLAIVEPMDYFCRDGKAQ
jgi:hypothetical protein